MSKAKTKNVLRTIIAIVYLVFGAVMAWQNFGGLFQWPGILTLALAVIMFIAGWIALFGGNKKTCRVLGIIIFVVAVASLIFNWFSIWALISAVIAWAFIALIK